MSLKFYQGSCLNSTVLQRITYWGHPFLNLESEDIDNTSVDKVINKV